MTQKAGQCQRQPQPERLVVFHGHDGAGNVLTRIAGESNGKTPAPEFRVCGTFHSQPSTNAPLTHARAGRFRAVFVVAQSILGSGISPSAPFSLGIRFRFWTGRLAAAGAGDGLGLAAAVAD